MIQSFKIVNYLGESLFLDIRRPEDTGLLVASVTGLNYPKTDIASQNYATFDGAKFGNLHIGTRNIVMNIIFYQDNKEKLDIESLRWRLQRYFLPKTEITFYATNEHGTFWIKGVVESNEINIFSKQEAAQISILCADPYFIKDNGSQNSINVGFVEPLFHFEFSIEMQGKESLPPYRKVQNEAGGYSIIAGDVYYDIVLNDEELDLGYNAIAIAALDAGNLEFGRIKDYPRTLINYEGSAVSGVTINIEANGPITGLRINNVTRGEYIIIDDTKLSQIVGSTISQFDQIIIDTRKGQKSAKLIRNSRTYNILNACLPVAKWIQIQTGQNEFTYSSTSDIENVDMHVSFPTQYLAI